MPNRPALATAGYWRELAEAGFRQALQVALPFLLVIAATGRLSTSAAAAAALACGVAFVVVVLRRLTGLVADPTDGPWVQLGYRAVSAFTGSLLGVLTADGVDVLALDLRQALLAAIGAATAAVIHGYLDPAASDVRSRLALAA